MELPLIVTAASTGEGMKRYLESARKLKNEAEFLFIEFQPQNPDELKSGEKWLIDFPDARRIIFKNKEYPGNLLRFMYLKDVMSKFGYLRDSGRWIMFTDTDDLIFQNHLPVLDQSKQIYIVSEGVTFGKSKTWTPILKKYLSLRVLADKPIYNPGIFMMRARYLQEFLDYLELKKDKIKSDYADQAHFNMWLNNKPKSVICEHTSLATCLSNNLKLGNIKKLGSYFVNLRGMPYSIIHANGKSKNLL